MVQKSSQIFLLLCQNARVWQTDKWTHRILIARLHLHSMQSGKNWLKFDIIIHTIVWHVSFRHSVLFREHYCITLLLRLRSHTHRRTQILFLLHGEPKNRKFYKLYYLESKVACQALLSEIKITQQISLSAQHAQWRNLTFNFSDISYKYNQCMSEYAKITHI